MYTGSLPSASIYGTWVDNVEVRAADDDELIDLSVMIEITLELCDRRTGYAELTLTLSDGDITIPSDGIVQWRAEVETMGTLAAKAYNVRLIFEDEDDVVPLILGTISIVE